MLLISPPFFDGVTVSPLQPVLLIRYAQLCMDGNGSDVQFDRSSTEHLIATYRHRSITYTSPTSQMLLA
eukprot:scaffold14319_cov148-Skeletonema_menzelii.AAC.2